VLDEHLKVGAAVLLGEGDRDQCRVLVGVRDAFERFGVDEAFVRDDFLELAVERDLETPFATMT